MLAWQPCQTHSTPKLTIRPNDRVHRRQRLALIQHIPSRALANRIPQPRRLLQEEARVVRRRQALQQRAHRRRQPVVDLVAGRPQRVAAGGGQRVDLEHGVVGRHGLERDVRVPAGRGEAAHVGELVREAAALLLLLRADDGDLVA